jgi:TonB family protein
MFRVSKCRLVYPVIATVLLWSSAAAKAQSDMEQSEADFQLAGPSGVLSGPFGRPNMVMDEGGILKPALQVYSDAAVECFIPDITSPGWAAWHAMEFRQSGTYSVIFYTYAKDLQRTTRESVAVDTRTNVATIREGLWGKPMEISLTKNPPRMARAFDRITAIVKHQIDLYSGLTIEQALAQDRVTVARMAASVTHDGTQSSVTATLRKKDDGSPAPIERRLPGSTPRNNASMQKPIVLYEVTPEYTEAARNAKLSGTVKIHLTANERGYPINISVVRGLGMGLDENAVEAVRQYRFRPAMLDGQAVPFDLYVDVNFEVK